jgi:subtilisin family serine protease
MRRAPTPRPRRPHRPPLETLEPRVALAGGLASELIVQFRDHAAPTLRRSLPTRLDADVTPLGHDSRVALWSFDDPAAARRAAARLRLNRSVLSITPNAALRPATLPDDPRYLNGSQWGVLGGDPAISPSIAPNAFGSNAEGAWAAGHLGSRSVYVGIIDEGVMIGHEDLAANAWTNPFDPADGIDNDGNGYVDDTHGWDFAANDRTVFDGPADDHGTLVAGVIGAAAGNALGIAGVSPAVTLIPAKFLGASGGTLANAIRALNYLTDLKTRHGIDVVAVNNSWTGGLYAKPLHDAIVRAARADILFVAAAGNNGKNNDTSATYPANYSTLAAVGYESVISVAALTNTGARASFSNFGAATVDIAAPGSNIASTTPGPKGDSAYGTASGTSLAAPFVTGAIALYAAAHPNATAAQIRAALLDSAAPTPSLAGRVATGGRLDVAAMLALAPPPAAVGSAAAAATPAPSAGRALTILAAPAAADAPDPWSFLRAGRPRNRGWWPASR